MIKTADENRRFFYYQFKADGSDKDGHLLMKNKKATWISGFLAVGENLLLLSELEQPSYVA
ncbi:MULTISPECIES: hypothetical protein [Vibrio]|uniref:Uncharacterized protein n=1 Tax=Vibrio diazotrophicus TaxID=685 RepID=A0ABX4WDK5_VIBDI|nr:hypothetical protein [Vibrio diazotrophicus]PNI01949.1 hypothetical protein C1O25_06410 [Vibrio diazotrophicus]